MTPMIDHFLRYMSEAQRPDPAVVLEYLNCGEEADDEFLSALDDAIDRAQKTGDYAHAKLLRSASRIGEEWYNEQLDNS